MKIFVAIFVVSCALTTYAQQACTGGAFDENLNYIKDSALCWVPVADNVKRFCNKDGKAHMDTWATSSVIYDLSLRGANPIPDIAKLAIGLANQCFCNIVGKIENNENLNRFVATTCNDFGALLYNGTIPEINDYMVKAYPTFNTLTGN